MNKPRVDCERQHTGFEVSDVRGAVDFYTSKLGFSPGFLWGEPEPTFAGVNLGQAQVFLQHGTPNPAGCSAYFVVGNADELFEFQRAGGVDIVVTPDDRDYLAEFKRMSLSSLLEETLLHTFEPLGDGVASPHTARDLRYIQELKQKHGIDYDCHASYRFTERPRS